MRHLGRHMLAVGLVAALGTTALPAETSARAIKATMFRHGNRPATNPAVIIFMENRSRTMVLGNSNMPYLNAFSAGGRTFTNFREGNPTGPSLPNYLQIAAGSSCGKTNDSVVAGDASIGNACPTTVWNQLKAKHVSWGVYEEGMPSACSSAVTYDDALTDGQYALKHNPATPFPSIFGNDRFCRRHVLPYSSFDTRRLRAVSFIAPNICNDQHGSTASTWTNCYSGSAALDRRGDDWLKAVVPAMLDAGATVLITYDEFGVMYAAEQGPGIPAGSTDGTAYTHYSILAAIEDRFGLARLGGAATAAALPL